MDVKRSDEIVKPRGAGLRKAGRDSANLLFAGAALAALLAGSAALGLVGWVPALILEGVFALVLLGLFAVRSSGDVLTSLSEEDANEVERLRRFSVLLDALPQPVLLLDGTDHVEVANAACTRAFGERIEGAHIASVVRAPNALETLREARHLNAAREAEFTALGPRSLSALFYVAPLENGGARGDGEMVVMIRDRTEQKKLERMRTDFIANASHELRTPLASILGFIETLQGHAKDDPEARTKFLKIMQAQTERMLRLVTDLVGLSTLELNERRLPEDEVDLCEVAAAVREMLAPVAAAANGAIAPGSRDCSAKITGDRDQILQVIQNLADNALKYGGKNDEEGGAVVHISVGQGTATAFQSADRSGDSPEQVAVRVGCRPEELLYVRVRDEGQGIEKTDLPRLTERFYRIDVERSRSRGGTGLGLAIVKHIVGRHRGGILVESAPGKGSAFTCYFPPRGSVDAD